MTPNEFARTSQYNYLYEGIMTTFPALKNLTDTRFQYVASPMSAEWTNQSYDIFYGLADAAPGEAGGFYTVGSGHISEAYANLINSVALSLGENDPAYQKLLDQFNTTVKLYNQKYQEAVDAYILQKSQGSTDAGSVTEWLQTPAGKAYQKALAQFDKQMDDYSAAMEKIVEKIGEPLSSAQKGLLTDQMSFVDGTKQVITIPRTIIGGDLQGDILRWQKLASNYKAGISVGFDLDVTMNKDTQLSTDWTATLDVSTKIRPCHPVEIEQKLNIQRILLDEHYSMNLKAIGCNTYPITRGIWYQDTFVRGDMKIYESGTFRISDFFGPKGVLRLIPTMMLVVYHPIIELTVSTKTYKQEIREQLKAYTGPFTFFGLEFDASKAPKVLEKEEVTTLTLEVADTQPAQLLGVISVDKTTVK